MNIQIQHVAYPSCRQLPDRDKRIWRYMNIEKFSYLLERKALYLRRSDLLQDKFEGTYSRRQIEDTSKWLSAIVSPEIAESEQRHRNNNRRTTYINCWCMSEYDYDLMWKSYILNSPGVAIQSTVGQLVNIRDTAIDYWPLDIAEVGYYDQEKGESIEYDRLSPFIHKDQHYQLDNEIRLIHWPNMSGPTPDHIDIPVDILQLITGIYMQPKATQALIETVKSILKKHGLERLQVFASRDDRERIE